MRNDPRAGLKKTFLKKIKRMSDTESASGAQEPCSTEDFKEHVREWIKIYDELAELRKTISALKKRKKTVGDKISVFMAANDKELCNLGNQGSLCLKKTVTSQALKREDIEAILMTMGNTEDAAKETAEFLTKNKRKKETMVLKRSLRVLD